MQNQPGTIAESIDRETESLKEQIEGAIRNFQSRTGMAVSIELLHRYEYGKLAPADSVVRISLNKLPPPSPIRK